MANCDGLAAGVRVAPKPRYTHVDLLRGLSALAVMMFHYRMFYPDGNVAGSATFVIERQPFFAWLWPFYEDGDLAVQFFWALSGFVFSASYQGQERTISGLKFFVWRFSRLYPLHIVTTLLVALLAGISSMALGHIVLADNIDLHHFMLNLFMASGWGLEHGYSYNAPIWSVSVEILIYIAFYIFMRIGRTSLPYVVAMAVLFGAIALPAKSPIPTCGFLFFLGAAVYRLVVWLHSRNATLAMAGGALAVLGSIALAVLFAKTGRNQFQIIMFLCIPSILFATAALDLGDRAVPRGLRWVGDVTYATYLLHFPLIMTYLIVANARALPYALPDQGWFLALYLGVVITVSLPVFRYFEMPAQDRLRDLYRRREGLSPRTIAPVAQDRAGEIT